MKVLIAGANGQLGHALQNILPKKGHNILCADLPETDFSVLNQARRYIMDNLPDTIINCAAFTNVDACESNPQAAMYGNAILPRNLAICASSFNIPLVHISTDYVFSGEIQKQPLYVWDMPNPKSVYGKTKLLGEQYVQNFSGGKYFIVRTAWLYGLIGNNFVKTIIKAGIEKGCLKVVNDQFGNPTNAEDLAEAVSGLIAADDYGLHHCSGQGICTWYDFACKIIEYAGIECTVTPCGTLEYPRPAPRPAWSALENTTGDMPLWEESLQIFINQIKQ
jgi:dTDP-4-dehydrorhamnose reductase